MPRQNNNHNLITMENPKSPISEAYRSLRTNIQFSAIDQNIKVLMVASSKSGEGKTTTITNLAVTYAQEGKRVLLIDADLRKPSLQQVFQLTNRTGLTSILLNQFPLMEVIRETSVDNLFVITSGPIPPNPSEILGSQRMLSFLEEVKEIYDVILFDTPPVLAVTDSLIVSSFCDGVLLVVHAGKVKKELVKKAKSSLDHVKAKILGVVLNNNSRSKADGQYYYYYYGGKE
ncbi:CpsD/CapB family tyrosine-protein kinase [Paenibacillus rhizovicinus]|uniref:non-specific protein-tyrosine kinase n=1 Tax=Paenibacillus rhizovicinus TaxID=2704463 RepID=A0A6C0NY48_9BACL|nr:CpsD/CapB family tyrosine-protein kinase [Paenibacillus rhizovicinus]QHW30866.1 CpsD/CapB family tyrosine-protein kinase [Paenibacillus rhizovicinus]